MSQDAALIEQISKMSEYDFQRLVLDILEDTGDYRTLKYSDDLQMRDTHFDILCNRVVNDRVQRVAFNIKSRLLPSSDLIRNETARRAILAKDFPDLDYILVVNGILTQKVMDEARAMGLRVWDARHVVSLLTPHLREKWFGLASQPSPETDISKSASLRGVLANIACGTEHFSQYQKWVSDVLEYLFVPPLGPVHYEAEDEARRNRRDVILENWAPDGFWAQLRQAYKADLIVVDAKNYAEPLKKRPVIDIAHYLKPYGCGLFGIICTRIGVEAGAKHAIREQWIGGQKMIIVLADEDMIEMLSLKESGASAEEIIRRKIGEFRKGL